MFSTENRDTRWTKKDMREHGLNVTRVGWSGIVSVGYWCSLDILPALKGEDSTKWIFRLRVSSGFKYAFA